MFNWLRDLFRRKPKAIEWVPPVRSIPKPAPWPPVPAPHSRDFDAAQRPRRAFGVPIPPGVGADGRAAPRTLPIQRPYRPPEPPPAPRADYSSTGYPSPSMQYFGPHSATPMHSMPFELPAERPRDWGDERRQPVSCSAPPSYEPPAPSPSYESSSSDSSSSCSSSSSSDY